ncbi:MAG: hypothetical protein K940chlam8_00610 [Chlamydiae bacterium]|nr:hypothetical protein [Chlamydiota bacterium]
MLKKTCLFIFGLSVLFANEIVYTQNNPPGQHKVPSKHAFLFNADLLVGKIQIDNIKYAEMSVDFGNTKEVHNYYLKNTPRIGFLAGIGCALNEYLNISIQCRYLHSGKIDAHTTPTNFTNLTVNPGAFVLNFLAPDPVQFSSRTKVRLLMADFLVQTSYWMMGKLRFQPLAGFRLQRKKFDYFLNAKSATQSYKESTFNKENRIGILIGTDIQFIINQYFYFFTTLLTQITTSTNNVSRFTVDDSTKPEILQQSSRDVAINNLHTWEYRFGLGWQHLFHRWLFSLRLFYELKEDTYEAYGCGMTAIF